MERIIKIQLKLISFHVRINVKSSLTINQQCKQCLCNEAVIKFGSLPPIKTERKHKNYPQIVCLHLLVFYRAIRWALSISVSWMNLWHSDFVTNWMEM